MLIFLSNFLPHACLNLNGCIMVVTSMCTLMESTWIKKRNSAASNLPNKTQYSSHKPCHSSSLIVGRCQDICSALWARGTYRAFSVLLHENCGLSSHDNSCTRLLLLLVTTSLWVSTGLLVIISRVSCKV